MIYLKFCDLNAVNKWEREIPSCKDNVNKEENEDF